VKKHVFSPSTCELVFTDYTALLMDDPCEARIRLECLLVNAVALGHYIRALECLAKVTEPSERCELDRTVVVEILKNGLRNINLDVLHKLVVDAETLSGLQCLVLEVDDPKSFWSLKHHDDTYLYVATADVEAEEDVADTELSPPTVVHTGALKSNPGIWTGPAIAATTNHLTMDAAAGMTCLIAENNAWASGGIMASGCSTMPENPLPPSPDEGGFSFACRSDLVRLDTHVRSKLSGLTAGKLSEQDIEEVTEEVIVFLLALAQRRRSADVSLREAEAAVNGVYDRVRRQQWLTGASNIVGETKRAAEYGRSRGANVGTSLSDVEKAVLVRRFDDYMPVHQVSRELGLNRNRVQTICDRMRREVTASLDTRSSQEFSFEAWSTLVTCFPAAMTEPAPLATPMRKSWRRLGHAQECLFWLTGGAGMTALMASAGPVKMVGGVAGLVAAYLAVTALKSLSPVDVEDVKDVKETMTNGSGLPWIWS
jgi:hypothetical protein